jgi:large subunit ribosomal protein L10
MRAEKQLLTKEYAARLNASPFFIVIGYQGLKVAHFSELRKRLQKAGAEVHVVKNSIFRIAAKEAGVAGIERLAYRANGRCDRTERYFRCCKGAEKFRRGI